MKVVLLARQKGRDIDLNQIAFLIFVPPQKSWFVCVRPLTKPVRLLGTGNLASQSVDRLFRRTSLFCTRSSTQIAD